MIKNYLKIAWRNLFKHKVFSFINIFGLSLGLASCILILQYVRYELSYEDHNEKADRIYRLQQNRFDQGKLTTQWAAGTAGIAQTVKEACPEVEAVLKLARSRAITSYKGKVFREERMYYVYPDVFSFFSCKPVKGNLTNALSDPNNMVMTASAAQRYFGREDPIGKIVTFNKGNIVFKVVAVIEDLPRNTHFKFDILLPFSKYVQLNGPESETSYSWDGFYSYVLLKKGSDVKSVEAKINTVAHKRYVEQVGLHDSNIEFRLQPFRDIHLYSSYMMEAETNGDGKTVYFLMIIAVFIIVIAWINYINLSTARSVDRAKEVGVRKVMGSYRSQLVLQFLFESFLINSFALLLSLLLIVCTLQLFNGLTGNEIGYSLFADAKFWLALLGLYFVGIASSGIYPAFALSSFKPIEVLKGRLTGNSRGALLRQGLVVVQFASSIALMVGTFSVYRQLNFMNEQDLGVKIDQTLVLRAPNVFDSLYATRLNTFKSELLNIPGVVQVAGSSSVPGNAVEWNAGGIYVVGSDPNKAHQFRPIAIDEDYMDVFGLRTLYGRAFLKNSVSDEKNVLINEESVKVFGFNKPEEALNKQIFFWGEQFTIVGIVSNHHQESLKEPYDAHIYRYMANGRTPGWYSLRLAKTGNNESTIAAIKSLWEKTVPENPFSYFFLDDNFQKQYNAERSFGKTFMLFAVLAIVIACLGLLGLTSYVTTQRTKEIGIRKVLGAGIVRILYNLTVTFIKPIVLSLVIAVPVTYYLLHLWLQQYAFKIAIGPWLFIVPVLIVFVIAILTITTQTFRAASMNPVKSLRTE